MYCVRLLLLFLFKRKRRACAAVAARKPATISGSLSHKAPLIIRTIIYLIFRRRLRPRRSCPKGNGRIFALVPKRRHRIHMDVDDVCARGGTLRDVHSSLRVTMRRQQHNVLVYIRYQVPGMSCCCRLKMLSLGIVLERVLDCERGVKDPSRSKIHTATRICVLYRYGYVCTFPWLCC